jgi:hypothetical protein
MGLSGGGVFFIARVVPEGLHLDDRAIRSEATWRIAADGVYAAITIRDR